jgi:hypothetical protein
VHQDKFSFACQMSMRNIVRHGPNHYKWTYNFGAIKERPMITTRLLALVIGVVLALAAVTVPRAQVIAGQAVDVSGAPQYRVDPLAEAAPQPVEHAAGHWHQRRPHGPRLVPEPRQRAAAE